MNTRRLRVCGLWLGLLLAATPAFAQTDLQLWGNLTLDWPRGDRRTLQLDVEPKVLVAAPAGTESWWSLDVTPSLTFAAKNWLDVVGEFSTITTHQTETLSSVELTPRIGAHVHLFSRELPAPLSARRPDRRERQPRRQLVLRDLIRVESRNLFYTDDSEDNSSTVRFRNRFELLTPLNRARLTDDGARYFMADWEWFIPLSDPAERFANKQRIRVGLGYRRDASWRLEGLYIWTRSRDTTTESFKTSDQIIDIRLKKVF